MQQIKCDDCGRLTPSYDIVNASSSREYRQLGGRCFNTKLAKLGGLDAFEHVQFEPVMLTDARGDTHEFHFCTHLLGTGVSLEAFERRDGHPAGYQFQVIGDPEDDLRRLLGRLIEKMRRALSVTHIEDGELGLQIAEPQTRVRLVEIMQHSRMGLYEHQGVENEYVLSRSHSRQTEALLNNIHRGG